VYNKSSFEAKENTMDLREIIYKNKQHFYKELVDVFKHTVEEAEEIHAIYANASAVLKHYLTDINWVGFYLFKNDKLHLGPFQGKPAVTVIPIGSGVCGTAYLEDKTLVVENVHEFCGHIACDIASNAEIVVPIRKNGQKLGVLDIDSPRLNRFDEDDQKGLETFVQTLETYLR
jgi:L-methionine (R)-S-oxide reductase